MARKIVFKTGRFVEENDMTRKISFKPINFSHSLRFNCVRDKVFRNTIRLKWLYFVFYGEKEIYNLNVSSRYLVLEGSTDDKRLDQEIRYAYKMLLSMLLERKDYLPPFTTLPNSNEVLISTNYLDRLKKAIATAEI